ncbi:MAG: hypothetical protein LBC99_06380 [Spirochaetota bacterium]|jgi:hypothetical protein|nr:hypothetical protein [Spirochaetota bacterium]
MQTNTPAAQTIRERLLKKQEFAGCAFSPEPRLHSYKLRRHLEFAALLLSPLNAPVLIITNDSKTYRVLFKDYPSLRYIVGPDAGETMHVRTRKTIIPLELFLEENIRRESGKQKPVNRSELWMLFAALIGAFIIVMIVYLFLS